MLLIKEDIREMNLWPPSDGFHNILFVKLINHIECIQNRISELSSY
jgi:hypothetical protein